MQMVGGNGRNQFRQYDGQNVGNQNRYNAVQNVGNQVVQNAVQNPGVENDGNQNRLIVVSEIVNQNPNRNGNVVAARDEGNANGNNVWNKVGEQSRGTVDQYPTTVEETRAYFESLYNNLAIKVEKVNKVNRKLRETNADLTTELARYKNQEKCFEISQEKYGKLESNPCKVLVVINTSDFKSNFLKEKSTVSSLLEEKKKLKSDFKTRQDELLDKQIPLVSEQEDTTKGTSTNTKFANQSTERKPSLQHLRKNLVVRQPNAFQSERTTFSKNWVPQKVDEMNDLSKPVTSNSVPTPQESKIMKNDNVITPGMFRITPFKPSREEKYVPNKVRASVRTNPITVSQPHVVTKKDVNSDSNGLSSTGVDNTAKTRRPQPSSNTKNDRVPSASKSSYNKNKKVKVEEHPRNLLLSKNKKHMSSECNHVKLAIQNDKSKVVCAMCKQCLITANHDVCVLNYVNDMNSHGKKQKANVSNTENQKKQKPKVMKPKKVGSNKRLASPKPSKPRSCLRWSPTGRLFDLKGKIIASSESESQSDCSNGDNACTSNPSEPTIKRFPNSTSFLGRREHLFCQKSRSGLTVKRKPFNNLYTINLHEMASSSQFAPLLELLLPRFTINRMDKEYMETMNSVQTRSLYATIVNNDTQKLYEGELDVLVLESLCMMIILVVQPSSAPRTAKDDASHLNHVYKLKKAHCMGFLKQATKGMVDEIVKDMPTVEAPQGGEKASFVISGERLIRDNSGGALFLGPKRLDGLAGPQRNLDCTALIFRGKQNICLYQFACCPKVFAMRITVNELWLSLQQVSNLL
ncbi:hypothetical protein Tco_0731213 [Tanacetum coccineum]